MWAYFRDPLAIFCEHVRVFALNMNSCFYSLHIDKNRTNARSILNIAAKKVNAYYTREFLFPEFRRQKLGVHVIHKYVYWFFV